MPIGKGHVRDMYTNSIQTHTHTHTHACMNAHTHTHTVQIPILSYYSTVVVVMLNAQVLRKAIREERPATELELGVSQNDPPRRMVNISLSHTSTV